MLAIDNRYYDKSVDRQESLKVRYLEISANKLECEIKIFKKYC